MLSHSSSRQRQRHVIDRSRSKKRHGTSTSESSLSAIETPSDKLGGGLSHHHHVNHVLKDDDEVLENAKNTPMFQRRAQHKNANHTGKREHDRQVVFDDETTEEVDGASRKRNQTKTHIDDSSDSADQRRKITKHRTRGLGLGNDDEGTVLQDSSGSEETNCSNNKHGTIAVRRSARNKAQANKVSPPSNHKTSKIEEQFTDSDNDVKESSNRRVTPNHRKVASQKRQSKAAAAKRITNARRATTSKKSVAHAHAASDSGVNAKSEERDDAVDGKRSPKQSTKALTPRRKQSRHKKQASKPQKYDDDDESYQAVEESESSFDDEGVADSESDESRKVSTAKQHKHQTRRQPTATAPLRRHSVDDEGEDDTDDDEDSNNEEVTQNARFTLDAKRKTALHGKQQSAKGSRQAARQGQKRNRSIRATRSSARTKSQPKGKSTPVSSARAQHKRSNSCESEDFSKPPSKRQKNTESDDEFVDFDNIDDDDELESDVVEIESEAEPDFFDTDSSEGDQKTRKTRPVQSKNPPRRGKNQNVQDGLETAESSSDDSIFDQKRQNKKKAPASALCDDSEDNGDTHWERHECVQMICPSEVDAITLDPLPSKHVCFIAPDGQSRQCFALETLRKIALTSDIVTFRDTFDGKHNFLQPPHFRCTMSDDMLDQIASRFGRQALDLHGEFYKSNSKRDNTVSHSQDDYLVHYSETLLDDEAFNATFQKYISNSMGSKDIYACPLCYTEVHRQLTGMKQADDKAIETPSFLNFVHDPMSVLGYLDNDRCAMASTFCFSKVADIKKHLREDHGVDTQVVEGNELYSRFKVRGQGGLLQTYINKLFSKSRRGALQGDMMRYWLEGNNRTFLLLLYQIRHREMYWTILQEDEPESHDGWADAHRENATLLWDESKAFFDSIKERGQQIWNVLSSPFRKATQEEVEDFIASDSSGGEGEEVNHLALHRSMMQKDEDSLEEKLVQHLRNKRAAYGSDVDDGDSDEPDIDDEDSSRALIDSDDDDEDDDDDGDEDLAMLQGYYSEVSQEEDPDEWRGKSSRPSPRRRRQVDRPLILSPAAKSPGQAKKLGVARRKSELQLGSILTTPPLVIDRAGESSAASGGMSRSTAKSKRVIVDSDIDEADPFTEVNDVRYSGNQPSAASNAKRVIVDSDEESVKLMFVKDDEK